MEERGAPNFQKGGRDADVMTFDSSSFKFHTNSDKCHTGDPLLKVVGCPPWAETALHEATKVQQHVARASFAACQCALLELRLHALLPCARERDKSSAGVALRHRSRINGALQA